MPVDVFYLNPTVWVPDSKINPLYCYINNESMLKGSSIALKNQASAFETVGNIFSPYYRQSNASLTLPLSEDQRDKVLRKIPAKDVRAAFD